MMERLTFRPIDPHGESALLIAFGRDLLFTATGNHVRFIEKFGADGTGYAGWISSKLAQEPGCALFACHDGRPAGMVVTGRFDQDETIGWIHHFYLEPAWRGRGVGDDLEAKAIDMLRERGFRTIRLAVSQTNHAARRFYARHGWADAGPRAAVPGHRYMEKII